MSTRLRSSNTLGFFPTDRPWHANGTQIIGKFGRKAQYVADVCRDNGALIAQDNADFIVLCVNSHDELLHALELCVNEWEGQRVTRKHEEAYQAGLAAITKVRNWNLLDPEELSNKGRS